MKNPLGKLFSRRSIPKSDTPIPLNGSGGTHSSKRKKKSPVGFIIAIVFVLGGILAGQRAISQKGPSITSPSVNGVTIKKEEVAIDRTFSFAAFNNNKKLTKKEIDYVVTSAEKTNEIVIQGKRATAVNGRTFLILNLKLNNSHDESLFLNTRNFIRVQPANTDDKLAPEIHNDTVEIQPDSTKLTRVGMPIEESQDTFTIYIGEVDDEEKEAIEVSF